ncbi:MAG: hypothetical protein Q7T54_00310 [Candidatus Levybacteria bacterium]|nr:hypothetical protein [Candidatus Levybacteria bacterium]
MGERLEYALHTFEATDPKILELRRLAHETHQDTAGLTPEQRVVLYAADKWIVGESIISDFDLHQAEVLRADHDLLLT